MSKNESFPTLRKGSFYIIPTLYLHGQNSAPLREINPAYLKKSDRSLDMGPSYHAAAK